jgi:hypothetical protein
MFTDKRPTIAWPIVEENYGEGIAFSRLSAFRTWSTSEMAIYRQRFETGVLFCFGRPFAQHGVLMGARGFI